MQDRRVGLYLENQKNGYDKNITNEQLFEELSNATSRKEKSEIQEKILLHNMPFVTYLVRKRFINIEETCNTYRITYDHIFSTGYYGLFKAVLTFKPEYKRKFSTYSSTCINNELSMMVRSLKGGMIQDSLNMVTGNDKNGNELALIDLLEDGNNLLEEFEKEEDMMIFLEEVERITKKSTDLDLIGMYFFEHINMEEISKMVGISRSYVSRKIQKIIRDAKKLYDKRLIP